MGIIVSSTEIRAPIEKVFEIASRVEEFPRFMSAVKTVEVRERKPDGHATTYWEAVAKIQNINKLVRWEEEAHWDRETHTAKFAQTTGDYKKYSGGWKFESTGDTTIVELTVDYDLGLPLIGALINKLLDKLTQENCDSMLAGLKGEAEKG